MCLGLGLFIYPALGYNYGKNCPCEKDIFQLRYWYGFGLCGSSLGMAILGIISLRGLLSLCLLLVLGLRLFQT